MENGMLRVSSHKTKKLIIKHKSLRLHSIPTRSYLSSKMKISSAACLLLLLRNAGGSNIRGSSVLKELKEQDESASIIEVSWNIGSNIVQIDSNV
jgi:hypothetical protein